MKKHYWRRGISGFCAVVITMVNCMSSMPCVYAVEENDDTKCVLSYQVTGSWDTGYTAEIKLTNVSDSDISDWEIAFTCSDSIVNLWGATIKDVECLEADEEQEQADSSDDTVSENATENDNSEEMMDENPGTEDASEHDPTEENNPDATEITEENIETEESNGDNEAGKETDETNIEITENPEENIVDGAVIVVSGGEGEETENLCYRYIISAESYNSIIRAGEEVTIGFLAYGSDMSICDEEINYTVIDRDNSVSDNEANTAYETGEGFPYVIYASSDIDGAIKINADNLCVNGNIMTNGTAQINGNTMLNGSLTERANEDVMYLSGKIRDTYLSGDSTSLSSGDLCIQNTNIDINTATLVEGCADLIGSVNINDTLAAYGDIELDGEVKNADNAILYSMYGSIVIDSQNVSLNGLIYAPFGSVKITAQNLNANGVVIIADEVELNGSIVNVNYGSEIAEFVGNENGEFEGIPYECIPYLRDKDEDGLPDLLEKEFSSDPENPDSDGDNLPDGYEVFTLGTDPSCSDSDQNGISDGDEDFDKDSLNNYQEYTRETHPWMDDSDGDDLMDGEEVLRYFSDPLKPDTDGEGLDDGDEILLGFSPLQPDTDGNGIHDCDEMIWQSYNYTTYEDEMIKEVSLTLHASRNLQKTTEIDDIINRDPLSAGVVGLFGHPYEINTTSSFDVGTLSFKIDQAQLGDVEIENLSIMWYDEENQNYQLMETEWDSANSVLSTEVTHFSRYMVVDKKAWFEAWSENLYNFRQNEGYASTETILAIDCSGSMSGNDPISVIPGTSSQPYSVNVCQRYYAAKYFTETKQINDKVGVVAFASRAVTLCELTNDKDIIEKSVRDFYNSGGTNFDNVLQVSMEMLENGDENAYKQIVLLTDGGATISTTNLIDIVRRKVKVYFVGLGNSQDARLIEYADAVNGEFIKAYTADDLVGIYKNIGMGTDFDMTDTDGDGLPDAIETAGIRMANGQIKYTDPTNPDTDGDTVPDGIEINPTIQYKQYTDLALQNLTGWCFVMMSDPTKTDSDGDGYSDDVDPRPLYNDIEILRLRKDYISVDATDTQTPGFGTATLYDYCNPWTSSNPGGFASYGGSQEWFGNLIAPYKRDDISASGCGLIALSDVNLYLSLSNPVFANGFTNGITNLQGIPFDDYIEYVYAFDSHLPINFNYVPYTQNNLVTLDGIMGLQTTEYFSRCGIPMQANWLILYTGSASIDTKIEEMIYNNIPAIFSIGPVYNKTYGKYIIYNVPRVYPYISMGNTDQKTSYSQAAYSINNHYMTITGIITDHVKEDMGTYDSVMYELSSWGNKYYFPKQEYDDVIDNMSDIHVDALTSILYIHQ